MTCNLHCEIEHVMNLSFNFFSIKVLKTTLKTVKTFSCHLSEDNSHSDLLFGQ